MGKAGYWIMWLNHMSPSDSCFDFSFIKEPRRERKIGRGNVNEDWGKIQKWRQAKGTVGLEHGNDFFPCYINVVVKKNKKKRLRTRIFFVVVSSLLFGWVDFCDWIIIYLQVGRHVEYVVTKRDTERKIEEAKQEIKWGEDLEFGI